jgi:hypothetical protein
MLGELGLRVEGLGKQEVRGGNHSSGRLRDILDILLAVKIPRTASSNFLVHICHFNVLQNLRFWALNWQVGVCAWRSL